MAGRLEGKPKHRAVFQFGHGNTVVCLLMILGVFAEDEALTADNYEMMDNRKFKLGIMAPMSGNVALVLYKCS